jgi:transposase
LSIAAALAFRWDGRRSRVYFQTRPGTYTDVALIGFLRTLKRHFRGAPIILLWDGLPAHKSGRTTRYRARQRRWLRIERLPAYAPDLNPVEQGWGNVKTRDVAISARPRSSPCAVLCAEALAASGARRPSRSVSCAMPAWSCDMAITVINEIH